MHAVSNVVRPFAFIALAALVSLSGCGVDPNTLDDSSTAGIDDGAYATENESDTIDTEETAEQSIDFRDCSCIDMSQVEDCRAPTTCTRYVRQGTVTRYCPRTLRSYTCAKYVGKVCRKTGFVKGSLPCCSGRAAVKAGKLRCQ